MAEIKCRFKQAFAQLGVLPVEHCEQKKLQTLRWHLANVAFDCAIISDSVKRHLSRRHLSVLNFKFKFIFNGGCTCEEHIALSIKRHLFPHGGRKPKAFWICFSTLPPISNIFSTF